MRSKKHILYLFLTLAALTAAITLTGCTGNVPDSEPETTDLISPVIDEVDYSDCFEGMNGCAVFYDSQSNGYKIYNQPMSQQKVSPCSTFKIVSTLIGLDRGILQSKDTRLDYSGKQYPIKSWNHDLTLEEAFQSSCVWYYRKVIDRVGPSDMQAALEQLHYGNCDISDWTGSPAPGQEDLSGFWLDSTLSISPINQAEIIAAIFNGDTYFKPEHVTLLKDLMFIKKTDAGTSVYGKTGTSALSSGWFVGFMEKDGQRISFAVYLNDSQTSGATGQGAKETAMRIIAQYYE